MLTSGKDQKVSLELIGSASTAWKVWQVAPTLPISDSKICIPRYVFKDMYFKICYARYIFRNIEKLPSVLPASKLHDSFPVFHDIDINHFSSLHCILWFNVETWWSQETIEKKKMVLICHKDLAKFYTTAVTINYIFGSEKSLGIV